MIPALSALKGSQAQAEYTARLIDSLLAGRPASTSEALCCAALRGRIASEILTALRSYE